MVSPTLEIDTRERPPSFIEGLQSALGGAFVMRPLPCADYALGTTLGIERKTVNNLVSSMVSRGADGKVELWSQLERCIERYKRVVLLVEGILLPYHDPGFCLADGKKRKVPWLAVTAVLVKVQEKGVFLVWTNSKDETIAWLQWARKRVWST